MNITVYLTNFNQVIYQGQDLYEATFAAKTAGYETHMVMQRGDQQATYVYSPISGWRTI
jgi:hypothetical protein